MDAVMSPAHMRQHVNCAHSFGPQSSEPITNGLSENFMRPVGGGQYGLVFGSERPAPTGDASAIDIGSIDTLRRGSRVKAQKRTGVESASEIRGAQRET